MFKSNEIEQSHKKLNGELHEQIEQVKKEADKLMMNKIIKYEKKIKELKQYADDMYKYPQEIMMNKIQKKLENFFKEKNLKSF